MTNNEENKVAGTNYLQTLYVVAQAVACLSLLANFVGILVYGRPFRHTILGNILFTAMWLGVSYSCVWDPIIRNRKKGMLFWVFLTIMTVAIPLLLNCF